MSKYYDQALKLARDLELQRGKIATHRDPKLTEEGLDDARQRATADLRTAALQQATDIGKNAAARAYMARLAAATARPHIADDAAALTRSSQKWEQAKMLLDSGRDIRSVVRGADLDTLLAIEEFAPSYLTAKQVAPSGLASLTGQTRPDISRLVENRMVDLVEPNTARAIQTAREAEDDASLAQPYVDHVTRFGEQGVISRSMLDLSIESQMLQSSHATAHSAEATAQPAA